MHPVDLPAVDVADLTSASEQYLTSLQSSSCNNEWFQSSQTSRVRDDSEAHDIVFLSAQIAITPNNVRRLQLFEDDQPDCTLLALHPPDDPAQVVAVYLHEKWWPVEDVLLTSSKSRSGLMSVQSIMERVIVFLLSQVVERSSQEQVLFSPHPRTESCKLLWRDGQVIGFYTIKHKGSLCDGWSGRCYLLPVLDTVLVRRSWRRRGFGLLMLDDFCSSFPTESFLGVSSPLSPSMAAVCRRFLQQHEEHRERLYEVEAPGAWTQRRNMWLKIQMGSYSLNTDEESTPSYSSQKMQNHSCEMDLTVQSTCNVSIPLVISSSEQQVELCDLSQGGRSPSSKTSGTGCSPAAHANELDSGPPTRPPQSLNTKQALISKPSLSTEPRREKPEETQISAKRVRRT